MKSFKEKKTEFKFYSLERFEYGKSKSFLDYYSLYDLRISSNNAVFEYNNETEKFSLNYEISTNSVIELINPLKNELKIFEKKDLKNRNYFPTSKWKFMIYFNFSINDIIRLFHITSYKNVLKNNFNYSEIFFYLKKIDFHGNYTFKFQKKDMTYKFNLFIYKNFQDDFDNLKFNHLVVKVKITIETLQNLLFFNSIKDKWFLNSQSYSQNNDINLNNKTFSEVIMENYPNLKIDFFWILLSLICYKIITYYGLIKMLLNYKEKILKFLQNINKFYSIIYYLCLETFKENLQDYKMNYDELFKYIEEKFENKNSEIKEHIFNIKIQNLTINYFSCFIPIVSDNPKNHLNLIDKKDLVNLKFRGNNNYETFYLRDKFAEAYVIFILKRGIGPNNIFKFIGYSESQYLDLSCYFINSDTKNYNILKMNESGKLLEFKKKFYIFFNSIIPINYRIPLEKMRKKKESKNNPNEISHFCCNKISEKLLNEISKNINQKTSFAIMLFNGFFGIWSTIISDKDYIIIDKSNYFSSLIPKNLVIYELSRPKKILLNYKYLRALFNQNEYKINFFVEILEKYIKNLDYIFSFFPFDHYWMEDLIKCFKKKNFFKDEFTIKIHEALYNLNKKIRFEEGIIYIKNSLVLRGVLDEYGKLNSGYIFVKIAPNNNPKDPNNYILKGKAILSKYPNGYKINLVKFSKSYHVNPNLVNVIIFSKYDKKFFESLNITDLSMEQFLLIWDEKIVENIKKEEYISQKNIKNQNVTYDEIYQDFCYSNRIIQKAMHKEKYKKDHSIIIELDKKINGYLINLEKTIDKFSKNKKKLTLDYKNIIYNFINKSNEILSKDQLLFLKNIILLTPLLIEFINSIYNILFKYNTNKLEDLLISNFNEKLFTTNFNHKRNIFFNELNTRINNFYSKIILINNLENKNIYFNEVYIISCICYNIFYNFEIIENIVKHNKKSIEELFEKEEEFNVKIYDNVYEIQNLGFDVDNYFDNIKIIENESPYFSDSFYEDFSNLQLLIQDKRLSSIPYLLFYKYIFILQNMTNITI